ncbi:MAG: GFA family protein [Xanthomonadales bacterium]|nr:GFA family protein [Xanthomonadales bacterium]NIX14020.1 GFA family protein [Xanthomonadales bacterium]
MFEGGCGCGRVRYRVDGEILEMSHCHCGMCRRLHGAAFGTYAGVRSTDFVWENGCASVRTFGSSPGVTRTFCGECGSTLQALYRQSPDMVYLTMGTVDGNPDHPEPFHIFVGSAAPWHDIMDDSPQYDTWRDGP